MLRTFALSGAVLCIFIQSNDLASADCELGWRPMAVTGGLFRTLAVWEGNLFVGGLMSGATTFDGAVSLKNAAMFDAQGQLVALGSVLAAYSSLVFEGDLYCTAFSSGGVRRWNGVEWEKVGSLPNPQAVCWALVNWDGGLTFAATRPPSFESAAYSLVNGSWIPSPAFSARLAGLQHGMAVYRGKLVVVGPGLEFPGLPAGYFNAAALSPGGTAWEPLGHLGAPLSPRTAAVFDDKLIVAGMPRDVSDTSVASWDGATWQPMSAGLPPPQQYETYMYTSLHEHEGRLYTGGPFGVYRWDDGVWTLLAKPPGQTLALTTYHGRLIAGGAFSLGDIGGFLAEYIAYQPGDVDRDGDVDEDDLNRLLAAHYGGSIAYELAADLNGDYNVNNVDLNILLENFGESCE